MCRLLSRTKAIRTSGNHEEFLQRLQQSEWHVSDDIVSVESDPRCPPPIVLASSPIFLFFFMYPCPFSDIHHPNSSHLLHIYSTSAPFIDVRCWSFFVDLAAFGLLVSRDRTKRLDPKRTAMIVFGNSRKLVSDLPLYSLCNAGIR
jgi:hypothetical protein